MCALTLGGGLPPKKLGEKTKRLKGCQARNQEREGQDL